MQKPMPCQSYLDPAQDHDQTWDKRDCSVPGTVSVSDWVTSTAACRSPWTRAFRLVSVHPP